MMAPELLATYDDRNPDSGGHVSAYLMVLASPREWPPHLYLASDYFILFLACDFAAFAREDWKVLVSGAFDAGCAYVCAWGDDSESLHDLFDEERYRRDPDATSDRFVMTTWHPQASIDEGLWYALFIARPEDRSAFSGKTSSVLTCAVGNTQYAVEIRERLLDPVAFGRRYTGEDIS